jgi:outer membrane protein TolC
MLDRSRFALACFFAALAGCASVDPASDHAAAREHIRAATGFEEAFDPAAPALDPGRVAALLADGLGRDEACRLALLNNRRLHAGFHALGVARAEYEQAGLLENPSLGLAFLLPSGGGRARWTADLAGSVAEAWRMPRRQAWARSSLDQRIIEVSAFAGELVASTRLAYDECVAAEEAASLAIAATDLARRFLAGVRVQVREGVASKSQEALAGNAALAAELAGQSVESGRRSARRRLGALLSLEADLIDVALLDGLGRQSPASFVGVDDLEARLAKRLDLQASSRAVVAAEEALAWERSRGFDLDAGLSAERPEGSGSADLVLGPAATLELPVFDQHQASRARAHSELLQRRAEHEALVLEARQALRAAADRASLALRAAEFAGTRLVPQAEATARLAERAIDLGDATVLELLDAQQALVAARRAELEARLEASRAFVELQRALGAPLDQQPAAR